MITRLRYLIEESREDETVQHTAARLAILGITPGMLTPLETKLVTRALQKVAYTGRSGGIA